jgi:hypothetical protein
MLNVMHPPFSRAKTGRTLLALAALLLCLPFAAHAGLVYGRVFGAETQFKPRDTIVIKSSNGQQVKTVKTDEYKGYSVYLPPAIYRVEFRDASNAIWEASIESYPQPVRQDIYLKKR